MKKYLQFIIVVMLITAMVVVVSLGACKAEGTTETDVEEAVVEESGADETADTGEAAEEVVAGSSELKDEYRFIQIPILVQSWFDQVFNNSVKAGDVMGAALGTKITWELQSPQEADVVVQTQMFEAAVATKPDGIAIDCVDPESQYPMLLAAYEQGIPVVQYVSYSPPGSPIPYVSIDLYADGRNVGLETIKRLEEKDKWGAGETIQVAVIQGVPTNSAHAQRYQATIDLMAEYPNIEIVAEGFDYDDVENAREEASRILAAHPDLDAFITCDAAGPVGAALAMVEADKVEQIVLVGHDTLPALAQLMLDGVLDLSLYADVVNFGNWVTVVLMMQNIGISPPYYIDTGYKLMTPENAEDFLEM